MYIDRIRLFKKLAKDKTILSGVLRKNKNGVPMGTPIMFIIDKKDEANSTIKPWNTEIDEKPAFMDEIGEPIPQKRIKKAANLKTMDHSSVMRELISNGGSVAEINEFMRENYFNTSVFIPFPFSMNLSPTTLSLTSRDIFFTGKKPLIEDDSVVIDLSKKLSSEEFVFDSKTGIDKAIASLTKISELLKTKRFVNITVSDINNSCMKTISEELTAIITALSIVFSYNDTVYRYGDAQKALLDTVSISFYNLEDTIPIFSSKKPKGISVEILATNSTICKTNNFINRSFCMISQMIFATESDGITQIDGEDLRKDYTELPTNEINTFINVLNNNTPLDTSLVSSSTV